MFCHPRRSPLLRNISSNFSCCTQRCYWPSSGVNITQAAVCSCLDFHHEQDEGRSRLVFDWCMLIFLLSDLHQVQRRKRSRHFIVHWRDEKETGIAFTDMFICFDHLQIESDRKTGMAIYLRWPSPDTKWQKDRHGSDWCVFTNLSWPSLDTKENVRQTCLWVSVFTNLCDFHQVQKRTWDRHVFDWRVFINLSWASPVTKENSRQTCLRLPCIHLPVLAFTSTKEHVRQTYLWLTCIHLPVWPSPS